MPDNPKEKLLILQLSEDSRKIARLFSKGTSIIILKLLDNSEDPLLVVLLMAF